MINNNSFADYMSAAYEEKVGLNHIDSSYLHITSQLHLHVDLSRRINR